MSLNSQAVEYFVAVARLGSVSRGALELGVQQSTVTRHISKLEADMGVRLFHRSGRGVVLTDAGRRFLIKAQHVVQALEQAKQLAANLAGNGPSKIVIAAQPTIAWLMFGRLATFLLERFPGVQLRFMEGLGHQMMGWLADGKIDVALHYVPTQTHAINFDILMQEPLYCVAAPHFSLPVRVLDIDALLSLPMVLPSTQYGLRGLVESLADSEGRSVNISVECDGSIDVTKRLVEAGHGCTVLPLAAVARECEAGILKVIPIQES